MKTKKVDFDVGFVRVYRKKVNMYVSTLIYRFRAKISLIFKPDFFLSSWKTVCRTGTWCRHFRNQYAIYWENYGIKLDRNRVGCDIIRGSTFDRIHIEKQEETLLTESLSGNLQDVKQQGRMVDERQKDKDENYGSNKNATSWELQTFEIHKIKYELLMTGQQMQTFILKKNNNNNSF